VSRVGGREGDSFISPRVQRETVDRLLAAHGHELVDWLEDLDESGGKWERPRFQEALARVEAGEANGIAVAKLDRFARSVLDALHAIERLNAANGHLLSAAESWDTTTPMGKAMVQIALVFAELERERQRESFEVARERAVRNGIHIASRVVLGYRRRDDRTLEPDPETAPLVPELFARRSRGETWAALASWLDEAAPRAGHWVGPTVAAMIRNRVYLGEARHGAYVRPDAHPALVSRAQFEAAQGTRRGARDRTGSLLAGLLVCGSCGRPMTHGWAGRRVEVYRCQGSSAAGRCPKPLLITASAADSYVEGFFVAALEEFNLLRTVASPVGSDETEELTRALEDAEYELAAYRDTELVSVIGRDAYVAGLAERASRVDTARRELVEAQTSAPWERDVPPADSWSVLETRDRRTLLEGLIEAIVVLPTTRGNRKIADRLRFVWKRPEEMGVELTTEHEWSAVPAK
jgi:site-specific DNA recombinase